MKSICLVPAYGRDYETKKQVIAAWNAGKDFRISDVSSQWNGGYASIRDIESGTKVKIRYKKLTEFHQFIEGSNESTIENRNEDTAETKETETIQETQGIQEA